MKGMRNALRVAIHLLVAGMLCTSLCVSAFAANREDSVELRVEKGMYSYICAGNTSRTRKRWREVAKFNHMGNPDLIFPGQKVEIPVRLMPAVPVDGKVTFVYGDADAQKDEKAEWATLSMGDAVSQGSRIRTGKASSVEVTFEDRNSIFVKSDTFLGITTSEKRAHHTVQVVSIWPSAGLLRS